MKKKIIISIIFICLICTNIIAFTGCEQTNHNQNEINQNEIVNIVHKIENIDEFHIKKIDEKGYNIVIAITEYNKKFYVSEELDCKQISYIICVTRYSYIDDSCIFAFNTVDLAKANETKMKKALNDMWNESPNIYENHSIKRIDNKLIFASEEKYKIFKEQILI